MVRNKMFKDSLCTSDKADWYPVIRENSFNKQLPGTIAQNSKFIQLLSIMVYPELANNVNFVKSKYWKMFVLLKTLCQYFMAPKLSDHQIDIQTKILKEYLKLRLSLIDEEDATSLSPKHLFALFYDETIRSVGCLAHSHTNREEAKNAQHKRRMTIGNNSKNVPFSILQNENHMNGILHKYGWFQSDYLSVVKLSEKTDSSEPIHSEIMKTLSNDSVVAEKIVYKNTRYNCDELSCVLIHTDKKKSSFSFGILIKIIINQSTNDENPNVLLICQCTKSTYLDDFGLYKIERMANKFCTVKIDELALFTPQQLHTVNDLSPDKFTAVSINKQPIIFPGMI